MLDHNHWWHFTQCIFSVSKYLFVGKEEYTCCVQINVMLAWSCSTVTSPERHGFSKTINRIACSTAIQIKNIENIKVPQMWHVVVMENPCFADQLGGKRNHVMMSPCWAYFGPGWIISVKISSYNLRANYGPAPSCWETSFQSNGVSYRVGANLE